MREARHQAVRPQFDISVPGDVKLVWNINQPPELKLLTPSQSGDAAMITLVNVGFAPATNVIVELHSNPKTSFDSNDDTEFQRYFEKAGLAFSHGHGQKHLAIHGQEHSADLWGFYDALGGPAKRISVAHVGQIINMEFLSNTFAIGFFDIVRDLIRAKKDSSRLKKRYLVDEFRDSLTVRYTSQSGEKLEQKISIGIRPIFLYQFDEGAKLISRELADNWRFMDLIFRQLYT